MEIPDFYRGRSVLLTGGTGFIGKALVEKLLRCCPEVERLYLLVRDKDGVSAEKRLSQLLALPVFAGCPIAKVTAVAGDVSVPGLGLSDEDRDVLVSHVSVVLHSAATIIFTEPLPLAVLLNVESVRHVVQLARAMKQLAAFVHVSTAYSNCNLPSVREEVYPPPADVHDMIRRAKEDPDGLERDATQLIGDRPNTYTFTKALAESLLVEEAADLPLAIVRPSIVGWAWRDPSPGYTDSANGMMGPLVLLAQGVVRSSLINVNCVVDLVPVDLVVNTVLAVAWHT
ncbi:fatty acyl-CoA reductase 1-like, partial [Thrips palmi]|uniref:Fatty acyl-CoA reductase n=1 Tax=Thrips palmi TaxID=161013 RepID=A0A6P8YMT9_THRPL